MSPMPTVNDPYKDNNLMAIGIVEQLRKELSPLCDNDLTLAGLEEIITRHYGMIVEARGEFKKRTKGLL